MSTPRPLDQTEDEPSPSGPLLIGTYQVRARIGEGGMGEVFECYDPRLMRVVAVKRVHAIRATSVKARARFWREARALAAVDHPGVVKIFEIGETADGGLFLAMQRVLGQSLEQQLGDGPWPWPAALALGARLAEILGAVHKAGVVHRDLKPSNVLVQSDGTPVLVDFGIAAGGDLDGGPLTDVGQVIGTISYMAPEQLEGRPDIGAPADIFAWGILVYRLLSGRHPFVRDTREQMAMALASGSYPPLGPLSADTPAPLVALIERCLAVDPQRRPQHGGELVAALAASGYASSGAFPKPPQAAAASDPVSALGPTEQPSSSPLPTRLPARANLAWVALAVVAVAIAAVVIVLWGRDEPTTALAPDATVAGAEVVRAERALPPRPVVILTNPTGDKDKTGAIIADVVRTDLAERPLDVIVAPESASADVDLRVAGSIADGKLTLVATDARDDQVRWTATAELAGRPPLIVARELASGLWRSLGLTPPAALPPLTTSVDAYRAMLEAREAGRRGDVAATRAKLEQVFRQDPRFVPARMEELALLRTERRMSELATAAEALLLRTDLAQHDRAMAAAWLAVAKGDPQTAVRGMYDVIDRWPYDLIAYESLLALLFIDTRVGDLAEGERVARAALTFAPRTPTIVSRYIRSLGWRGRGDRTEAELQKLGVPLDEWPDTRAEIALYRGDFEAAIAGLDAWVEREPEHVYALNMGFAARILAGRCTEAAENALARITRVERRGTDDNLAWSYSLAVQALSCVGSWDAARTNIARWTKRHPESAGETRWHLQWIALASGQPEADIVAGIGAIIDADLSESKPPPLEGCELLGIIATAPEQLAACKTASEARAFDLDVPTHDRARWTRLGKRIRARTLWLAGEQGQALTIIRDAVYPMTDARHESDMPQRVEAQLMLARSATGDEAAATWKAIEHAGYARVYRTHLWTIAHAQARTLPDPR